MRTEDMSTILMELKSNMETVSKTIFAVDKTKASKIPDPV
jgi:hypothetical protein